MNKDELGKIIAPGVIRFERRLPKPIETVWAYLTDPEKRGQWLAKGKMDLRVGGEVELEFLHADLSNEWVATPDRFKHMEKGHRFSGTVTRCEIPFVLAFTWQGNSEVTFELMEEKDCIRLVLTHRKLGEDPRTMISVGSGWHTHLHILVDRMLHREPPSFWTTYVQMEAQYENVINTSI